MYCALAAGLHVVLERCWPGSMLCSPDFVRCRSGLVFAFGYCFAFIVVRYHIHTYLCLYTPSGFCFCHPKKTFNGIAQNFPYESLAKTQHIL